MIFIRFNSCHSLTNSLIKNMRNFYLEYQICQTLSGKLTWSHYCELLGIADKNEREFYQNECVNSLWSVREQMV
jgi:hypothetical protein